MTSRSPARRSARTPVINWQGGQTPTPREGSAWSVAVGDRLFAPRILPPQRRRSACCCASPTQLGHATTTRRAAPSTTPPAPRPRRNPSRGVCHYLAAGVIAARQTREPDAAYRPSSAPAGERACCAPKTTSPRFPCVHRRVHADMGAAGCARRPPHVAGLRSPTRARARAGAPAAALVPGRAPPPSVLALLSIMGITRRTCPLAGGNCFFRRKVGWCRQHHADAGPRLALTWGRATTTTGSLLLLSSGGG